MGNQLPVPGTVPAVPVLVDVCCMTMDMGDSRMPPPPDESADLELATLLAHNSFEIMNKFTWDMVDTIPCRLCFSVMERSCHSHLV